MISSACGPTKWAPRMRPDGVVCGIAAAIAVTRLMSALLFQISPVDPITYVAVPIVLVAVLCSPVTFLRGEPRWLIRSMLCA